MNVTPVLLPGNMCDSRLWTRPLREVMSGAVDADLTQDDSIADMATRTFAAVDGPLLLVGFSMGAIVAVEMWAQQRRRICGLVLLGYNAGADLLERAAHRPLQQAEVRSGGLERVLVEELKPNYLGAANRSDAALLELLRDMGLALGPDVFVRQSEALRLRRDRRPALAKMRLPVLYGCGIEDTLCPPGWHHEWAAATPGSRLVMLAGAGHMLPLEQPDATASMIDQWIHDNREALTP